MGFATRTVRTFRCKIMASYSLSFFLSHLSSVLFTNSEYLFTLSYFFLPFSPIVEFLSPLSTISSLVPLFLFQREIINALCTLLRRSGSRLPSHPRIE